MNSAENFPRIIVIEIENDSVVSPETKFKRCYSQIGLRLARMRVKGKSVFDYDIHLMANKRNTNLVMVNHVQEKKQS